MAIKLVVAAAAVIVVAAGCTTQNRYSEPRAADRQAVPASTDNTYRPANTPAMTPDRVNPYTPRSFSDPGPNYPDTGR